MVFPTDQRLKGMTAPLIRASAGIFLFCGAFALGQDAGLAPPAALPATDVTLTGFIANWEAVPGADNYFLDVFRFDDVPPTVVHEGFDGYPGVTPAGWTIRNSGGTYTGGGNFGQASPSVRLEASGHAITTAVFSAAVTNLSFWYKGNGNTVTSFLHVAASNMTGWIEIDTITLTDQSAAAAQYGFKKSAGYSCFRLRYEKILGNVGIDDVSVVYSDGAKEFVLSNVTAGAATSYAVGNLTPGVYFYVVRAEDGSAASSDSNMIEVDTEKLPTPPQLVPVLEQTVRVGETLAFPVNVVTTDNDPVLEVQAVASAGVSGAWELADGVFTYTPVAADVGEMTFTFTARDKDGWSEAMAVDVLVRPARTAAVRMTGVSGVYTQDFNTLAQSGQDIHWDNAVTPLPAWYAYASSQEVTSYRTGPGSGTVGGIYSFGAAGSADRSLGTLAASGNTMRFGAAFTNETGMTVTNLAVRFKCAQWRVGASMVTNTLVFDFCVTNQVLPLHQGVWRRSNALCYDSPLVTNSTLTAGAVASPEKAELSTDITRPIPPGGVVMLRWSDVDDAGGDHGFGIDDVVVAWSAGAAPDAIPVGRAGMVEGFDCMGPDAAGELPWPWRVEERHDAPRVNGAYAAAGNRVTSPGGVGVFPAPGSYVFASDGVWDQAVGALPSATQAQSVSFFAKFGNMTGTSIRRWAVRFAVEKHRNGLAGCAVRMLCSVDGETWNPAGEPVVFPADADTAVVPVLAEPVRAERIVVFGTPSPMGSAFYLAWQISVAEGGASADAQALAIDDVWVEPVLPRASLLMVK